MDVKLKETLLSFSDDGERRSHWNFLLNVILKLERNCYLIIDKEIPMSFLVASSGQYKNADSAQKENCAHA